MLRFSLVFPDQAPTRFAATLRSGNVTRMRKEMAETVENGLPTDLKDAVATALAMISGLSKHDKGTRGHSERVRAYSEMLAEEMQLGKEFRDRLRWGALLHDMGKLAVPAEILNKSGRPTEEEWAILQTHPAAGGRILAPLADWMGDAVNAASQHHERWDGKGYPAGLAGEEISLSARIVAVADAFAVMTGARSYKKPLSMEVAREELARNSGTQFDPAVVRAMLSVSVGQVTRAAGFLAPLANAPLLGSLLSATSAVPGMVVSGVAAAATVTVSLAIPASPLHWTSPSTPLIASVAERGAIVPIDTSPPALALVSESTPPASTLTPKSNGPKPTAVVSTVVQSFDRGAESLADAPGSLLTTAPPTVAGSQRNGEDPTTTSTPSSTTTAGGTFAVAVTLVRSSVVPTTLRASSSTVPRSVTTSTTASPETKPPTVTTQTTSPSTKPNVTTTTVEVADTKPPTTTIPIVITTLPPSSETTPPPPTTSTIPETKPSKLPPLGTTTTAPSTTSPTVISDTKSPPTTTTTTTTTSPADKKS